MVFVREMKTVFFPFQWTRSCISLDSAGREVALVVDGQLVVIMIVVMMVIVVVSLMMRTMIKVALVVDGQMVGEKEFKKEEIFFRQDSRFDVFILNLFQARQSHPGAWVQSYLWL